MRIDQPYRCSISRFHRPVIDVLEQRVLLSTTFATPVQAPGVVSPNAIATGDLNGDGKPDMVVIGYAPSATNVPVVGVYLNNGTGEFGTPTLLPFSGTLAGLALGTFEGGHTQDIAVVDSADNQVLTFIGDGAGNFTPGAGFSLGGTGGATAVISGEFNGDLETDLAILEPQSNLVQIAISQGDGSFVLGAPISVPDPVAAVIADFNKDGNDDLAIASGNGQVYIALGDGAGAFRIGGPYSFGSSFTSLTSLATADFNGDGLPDLVGLGTSNGTQTVSVLLNGGGGTFASVPTTFTPQSTATLVATGAFAGTANQDIAVLGSDGSFELFDGEGTGQFAPDTSSTLSSLNLGAPVNQVITADFDGNSTPDIAYVSGNGGIGEMLDTTGVSTSTATLVPTIAKSTLPASVVAGVTAHGSATVEVTDSSSKAGKEIVTVDLYASTDGTIDSSSVLLGSTKKLTPFKTGVPAPFTVAEKVPATLTAGTYTLLAQVVDPSKVLSTSAPGPTLTAAGAFIAFSETLIKTTLPASAVTGQKSTATAELKITNTGNSSSSKRSTIALYFSPDAVAADGTLIRSQLQPIPLKPGASSNYTVRLVNLPSMTNGNYFLVAQVTDPNGDVTSVASGGTFALSAPVLDLVPSAATVVIARNGSAIITFMATNQGNIAPVGPSTVSVNSSADGTLADALPVYTRHQTLPLAPNAPKIERIVLTRAQVTTLQAGAAAFLEITDPLGDVETIVLTGI